MFLMCFFCASQDMATDALAVGLLEPYERGLGNGVQNAGGYLGGTIGGGGMLILLNHWGWTASLLTLALIVVVALFPVLWHRERVKGIGNREWERQPSHSPLSIPYFLLQRGVLAREEPHSAHPGD
jgi:MFS family permease